MRWRERGRAPETHHERRGQAGWRRHNDRLACSPRTVTVSPQTAQRVKTAVDQLQYRPNELARAFRGHGSRSIGLIIPYLYDPFFANCAQAVTTIAREHGYSVIITTSNEDPDTEFVEAEQMLQRHVDGVMVIPARFRQSRLTRAFFGKTPVVAFDGPVSDPA